MTNPITPGNLRQRLRAIVKNLDDDLERYTHIQTLAHHVEQAERTLQIILEREALRVAKLNAKRAMKGLPPYVKPGQRVDPGDPAETQRIIDLLEEDKKESGELRDEKGNLIRTEGWAMDLDQLELPRDEHGRMLVDPTDDHAAAMREAGQGVGVPQRLQERMESRDRPEVDAGEAVDHVAEKCRPLKEESA